MDRPPNGTLEGGTGAWSLPVEDRRRVPIVATRPVRSAARRWSSIDQWLNGIGALLERTGCGGAVNGGLHLTKQPASRPPRCPPTSVRGAVGVVAGRWKIADRPPFCPLVQSKFSSYLPV